MQIANIRVKRNEDFNLTLRLTDSKYVPLYINGALFYMSIREKESGNILVATISNDDTIARQGNVYIIDYDNSKIRLFLQKEHYNDKKFINTWKYDLVMKQNNSYTNLCGGNFVIEDAVTDIDQQLAGVLV